MTMAPTNQPVPTTPTDLETRVANRKRDLISEIVEHKKNSSRAGVASRLAFVDLHGLTDDFLTGYVRRVLTVTPQQVQQMAQLYLRPDRMQLVVVGDRKVVQEQLAPWGTVVP